MTLRGTNHRNRKLQNQNNMESNTLENSDVESLHEVKQDKPKRKRKECGIIYLSRIPTFMNVNIVRRYFEKYGETGKIFLQPDRKFSGIIFIYLSS